MARSEPASGDADANSSAYRYAKTCNQDSRAQNSHRHSNGHGNSCVSDSRGDTDIGTDPDTN